MTDQPTMTTTGAGPTGPGAEATVTTTVPTRPSLTAAARWRRFAVRACVLYTVLTVVSSSLALATGQETDTHVHLLVRLVFVLIGLGAFEAVDALRRRYPGAPSWSLALAGYLVAVLAILVGLRVFAATGGDLHPNAYRDAFLNFTAVGVGVIAVVAVRDAVRSRRR